MAGDNFPLKKDIFWPMGQKDGNFLFWSMPDPKVTFLGLKNHTFPYDVFFWNTLYNDRRMRRLRTASWLAWYSKIIN